MVVCEAALRRFHELLIAQHGRLAPGTYEVLPARGSDLHWVALLGNVHPLSYSATVAPGAWDLSTAQFRRNGMPAGPHTIEIQAEVAEASPGSGAGQVTFGSRSMLVVQFGPIFVPPG